MSGPYSVDLLVEGHNAPVTYETDLSDVEVDRWFRRLHVGDRVLVPGTEEQLPIREIRVRYQDRYIKVKNWKE